MYTTFNIIDDLLADATKFVVDNDRAFYLGFLKSAENYCIKHGGILGGKNGIYALLDKAEDSMMEIYIENAFTHARGIADSMYIEGKDQEWIPIKTISVESRIRNKYFTIWVNGRPLINCINVEKYRNVNLIDLVDAVEVKSRWHDGQLIKCMGPYIQLMFIYDKLYQPYGTKDQDSYTKLLELEDELVGYNVTAGNDIIEGGGSSVIEIRDFVEIIIGVVREFIAGATTSNIIIGDYALGALNLCNIAAKFDSRKRFQMISADDPEDITNKILQIVRRVMKKSSYSVEMMDYDLKLVNDQYLRKYTFYVTSGKDQQPLLDVFNSTTYEVVPYMTVEIGARGGYTTKAKIAGWFVLIRFRLIELYAIRLISKLGSSNQKFMENKINELSSSIKTIRKATMEKIKNTPFEVFQLKNFEGCFIEQNILFKKLMANEKPNYGRYYPHLELNKKGSGNNSGSNGSNGSNGDADNADTDTDTDGFVHSFLSEYD